MNASVSSISRRLTVARTGIKKEEGPQQKNCAGFPICKKTLSAKSKHKDCQACRNHNRKWGAKGVDIDDIEYWHHRAEVQVYRFGKHLPSKVSTVRRRA